MQFIIIQILFFLGYEKEQIYRERDGSRGEAAGKRDECGSDQPGTGDIEDNAVQVEVQVQRDGGVPGEAPKGTRGREPEAEAYVCGPGIGQPYTGGGDFQQREAGLHKDRQRSGVYLREVEGVVPCQRHRAQVHAARQADTEQLHRAFQRKLQEGRP